MNFDLMQIENTNNNADLNSFNIEKLLKVEMHLQI